MTEEKPDLDRNIEIMRKELTILKRKYVCGNISLKNHINIALTKIDSIQNQISEEKQFIAEQFFQFGYYLGVKIPNLDIDEILKEFKKQYNEDE